MSAVADFLVILPIVSEPIAPYLVVKGRRGVLKMTNIKGDGGTTV